VRMVNEAENEFLVISDSDVRVRPDYLRTVVAPLCDPKVGCVTCFYVSIHDETFAQHLQSIGMYSDFYPGILVARQLDGVKFTLGLPWCLAIVLTHSRAIGLAYVAAYLGFRVAMTGLIGVWGLQQKGLWKWMPLIVVWDATAFVIWLLSFGRSRIRWRNVDYR